MLDMPNAEKMENVIRLYKAILTQAIVDALYDPTKKDLKAEEKFKARVKKHGYFTQKGKPITLKNKAKLLLDRLKRDSNIAWNNKGEVSIKGEFLPNFNINDLIQDLLRNRKSHIPKNWETFARYLYDNNIPKELVGNNDRWQWMISNTSPKKVRSRKVTTTEHAQRKLVWTPY